MRESKFNTEVVNSLKELGAFAEKIPDMPFAGGLRFNPEKPCDIFGGFMGRFFIGESKQMKKFEALGERHFRPNQIKALDKAISTGNRAFVFLNVRIKAVKGEVKHENRMIILDWKVWGGMIKNGSIKAKQIKELPYIVGHKGLFDLKHFLMELGEIEKWRS